jgi:hypothetical protein
MSEVGFLAFAPGRPRQLIGIGTGGNDLSDRFSEMSLDIVKAFGTAGIFDSIVQQCGNRFFFVPAMLKNDTGYAEQVRDVRHIRLSATLAGMNSSGIDEGFFEFGR